MLHRLQNSEQERKQSDRSDKDMRTELEGKVDALQKQLTDLDTLRLKHTLILVGCKLACYRTVRIKPHDR